MEKNTTYNGWTNYATWRIALEVFCDYNCNNDFYDESESPDVEYLADSLDEQLHEILAEQCANELTLSYAYAFISNVNFREIAQHIIDEQTTNNEQG